MFQSEFQCLYVALHEPAWMCLSVRVNNIRSFLCVHKRGKKELDKDHVIFRGFIIVIKDLLK